MRWTRLERLSTSASSATVSRDLELMTPGPSDPSPYCSSASFRILRSSPGLSAVPPQRAGEMASPKWQGRSTLTPVVWIALRLTILLCALLMIAWYVAN
jgi:hypothetical protein